MKLERGLGQEIFGDGVRAPREDSFIWIRFIQWDKRIGQYDEISFKYKTECCLTLLRVPYSH